MRAKLLDWSIKLVGWMVFVCECVLVLCFTRYQVLLNSHPNLMHSCYFFISWLLDKASCKWWKWRSTKIHPCNINCFYCGVYCGSSISTEWYHQWFISCSLLRYITTFRLCITYVGGLMNGYISYFCIFYVCINADLGISLSVMPIICWRWNV